jgi:hypothetical protein
MRVLLSPRFQASIAFWEIASTALPAAAGQIGHFACELPTTSFDAVYFLDRDRIAARHPTPHLSVQSGPWPLLDAVIGPGHRLGLF